MSKLAEVNKRIKGKLAEIEDNKEGRLRLRQRVTRIDLRFEEIRDDLLPQARREKRRSLKVVEEIKADLAEAEAESPDEDTEEEKEFRALLEQASGEHEADVRTVDRLLSKLDLLAERRQDAREALEAIVKENAEDRRALARMRSRRRRIQEARERNDRPSSNFDWAEFDCNDGTPIPEVAKPAIRHLCETVLEPLRAQFGAIHINSGYRTDAWNAHVGGETNSVHKYHVHIKAVAADCICAKGSPSQWHAFTAGKADGRGVYSSFVHNDNRNRIGWSDAVWSG